MFWRVKKQSITESRIGVRTCWGLQERERTEPTDLYTQLKTRDRWNESAGHMSQVTWPAYTLPFNKLLYIWSIQGVHPLYI